MYVCTITAMGLNYIPDFLLSMFFVAVDTLKVTLGATGGGEESTGIVLALSLGGGTSPKLGSGPSIDSDEAFRKIEY